MHIPKCAGTSMMGLLKANYGDGFHRVGNGGGWRKFRRMRKAQRAAITCLTGHIPWGLGVHLGRPVQYAVMLRDPVERVASLYWFCRMAGGHKYHKLAQKRGLVAFIQSGAFADLDNGMTRWLAGRQDVGSLAIRAPVTEWDLQRALEHLRASWVGIVRRFDAFVRLLAKSHDWTHLEYERKMRGFYPRPTVTERRAIEQANAFDVDLYGQAVRMV